ncbi:MAG TPA: hypothetical protein VKD71_06915, partial [Gemmataceae bacterium]|nr:hypothetical protein [Gemmataceae bacterium]
AVSGDDGNFSGNIGLGTGHPEIYEPDRVVPAEGVDPHSFYLIRPDGRDDDPFGRDGCPVNKDLAAALVDDD